MTLSISTSGRIASTNEQPGLWLSINGKFKYDPLKPIVRLSDTYAPLKLRGKHYRIPPLKWMKLAPLPKFDVQNIYLRSLGAMYVATVKCGICHACLADPHVGGLLKYHVYLTFQIMMQNPDLLERQLTWIDKKIIMRNIPPPKVVIIPDPPGLPKDALWDEVRQYNTHPYDYTTMIHDKGDGITAYGRKRVTDSILTFIYCVLLSQGKTGYPLVGKVGESNGMVGVTLEVFNDLHRQRVESGTNTQSIRDTVASLGLIIPKTTQWLDISKGIIRIPANTLLLYKLIGDGENALKATPLREEEETATVRELKEEDIKTETAEEDSDKEEEEEEIHPSTIQLPEEEEKEIHPLLTSLLLGCTILFGLYL